MNIGLTRRIESFVLRLATSIPSRGKHFPSFIVKSHASVAKRCLRRATASIGFVLNNAALCRENLQELERLPYAEIAGKSFSPFQVFIGSFVRTHVLFLLVVQF